MHSNEAPSVHCARRQADARSSDQSPYAMPSDRPGVGADLAAWNAQSLADLLPAMFDSTPDWLFAKDLEHRFLYVNRSFAQAVGLTPADMIGHGDTEFWGPEQCEPNPATGHRGFHADDRRAFAGETVRNPHDEATIADGSLRVFDTVKSPLRDTDGRIIGVLCYCRDVTDRHRAELALKESEDRFRTVVGNIPGAVYRSEVHPPYRDLFLSEGIRSLSGYAAEEYFAEGGPTCGSLIHPDDLPIVEAQVQAAIEGRRPYQVRYRVRHRDGSLRWILDQGRATHGPDGSPLFLDGVHIDITAQVDAEDEARRKDDSLRAIVEYEPECVKVLGPGGVIQQMNPAGLRMLQAEELSQVLGRPAGSFVVPAHRRAFDDLIDSVFAGTPGALVFEAVGLKGTQRTLETHCVPLWGESLNGEIRSALSVTRDITERLKAEADRSRLEAQLRQAQKLQAMGTLARGIAHDFNNLLSVILGQSELMLYASGAGVDRTHGLEEIHKAAMRGRDLVRQILTFSQRRELERKPVQLEAVATEALQMLRAVLPTTIEIRTSFSAGGQQVLAEVTQVHQVLMNLCTNAQHAMRGRNGVLTLGCRTVDVGADDCRRVPDLRPGRYLLLWVSDTGHGMDAQTLERVFEPFFTTKPPGEGSGLGLAVVHGIMNSHGGAIGVHSVPGQGTSFELYFPAVDAAPGPSTGVDPPSRSGTGQHVLVVDDEPSIVTVTSHMLRSLGYRCTGVHDPLEAWERFQRAPQEFDMVILDLAMPRMTGLELAEAVHKVRPELPVLVATGCGSDLSREDTLRAGVHTVLEKPLRVPVLAATLAACRAGPG